MNLESQINDVEFDCSTTDIVFRIEQFNTRLANLFRSINDEIVLLHSTLDNLQSKIDFVETKLEDTLDRINILMELAD